MCRVSCCAVSPSCGRLSCARSRRVARASGRPPPRPTSSRRGRTALDRRARPARRSVPRRDGLRRRRAVSLDHDGRGRRHDVRRHRQRRQGVSRSIARRHAASLFFDSAELEVHALAPAPDGGLYVGTSPDGRIYKVDAAGTGDDVLRSGRQIHLGARGRRDGQCLRRPPATRASSTRSRPTARARRSTSTKATHATALAVRRRRAAARRHRIAGPRVPRRRAGQGLPAARHAVSRKSAPCASIERRASTSPP